MNIQYIISNAFYCLKASVISLSHKGIKIDKGVRIMGRHKIYSKNGTIIFSRNVGIEENSYFFAINGGQINVNQGVYFNRNCTVVAHKSIQVGENTLFGPNVCIYDHDHKFDETGVKSDEFNEAEVCIGKNCWIGAGCIILKGTIIGDNCVVAAGTLLKGKYPSNSLIRNEKQMVVKKIEI